MRTQDNVELLQGLYKLLASGDLDRAAAHLTEDFVAHQPGRPEPSLGRDTWRAGAQHMLDAFPDLRITIDDIFGAGDQVVVRLHFAGTHQGPFLEIPPTQRQVEFASLELYRVEDGQVAEEWVAPDMLGLLRQLTS
ncbi:steroid delta-isomerase-like uncharacterized protein [Kribbella amoyensis]|uniref:Steroid delta-isomerase-like uncharacterized protein n=1 Tax=Kribbella amoyensis TaxID=996641 RepID=A0A561BUG8_9ACTN|nr:ester cyclase [Kribbella amoyensis]TWD82451.1 steroid delta-isomerase-like uncharacterized protein [Kribbella amoyensis]